ncbi:hypothetical protein Hanom_Chr03g00235921 [Helianthus anomalus]
MDLHLSMRLKHVHSIRNISYKPCPPLNWNTDGPLEYHRATSRTPRSYPSPLGNNVYTPIQEETQ